MEKERTLGITYFASAALTLALAGLLAGCSHAPLRVASRDALAPEEHVRLGAAYEAQGLRAEAAGQYKAAVRLDPANAGGWLALGDLMFTEGRFKEAESCFRKALKFSPHDPGAANNLAMAILARNGSLPEAEALAQGALANAGALRVYILDTLANIFLRQRRFAEAAAAIDQAEAITPAENAQVRSQLLETRRNIAAAAPALP